MTANANVVSDREQLIAGLYRATKTPQLVEVPALTFLMIDGHGDPNTSVEYQDAIQALYTLSYGVKFAIKRAGGTDYKVSPLEGLWWAADLEAFTAGDKAAWDWTAMIRQPDEIDRDLLARVAEEASRKRDLAALPLVRLETFTEGLAAQILHVGPYADEAPTIERLHAFLTGQGLHLDGKHHEIYLGDPRRAAPERLRTVLRQPATRTPVG